MVIKMVLKVLAAEQCQQTTLQEVEQLHAKFLMVPLLYLPSLPSYTIQINMARLRYVPMLWESARMIEAASCIERRFALKQLSRGRAWVP